MNHNSTIISAPILERDLFIDNTWRPSSNGASISLINPATEQPFGRAAAASNDDMDAAVAAARAAFDFGPWPRLTMQERAAAILRFGEELEADIDPLAELVLMETGLPLADCKGGTLAMLAVLRLLCEPRKQRSTHRTAHRPDRR